MSHGRCNLASVKAKSIGKMWNHLPDLVLCQFEPLKRPSPRPLCSCIVALRSLYKSNRHAVLTDVLRGRCLANNRKGWVADINPEHDPLAAACSKSCKLVRSQPVEINTSCAEALLTVKSCLRGVHALFHVRFLSAQGRWLRRQTVCKAQQS